MDMFRMLWLHWRRPSQVPRLRWFSRRRRCRTSVTTRPTRMPWLARQLSVHLPPLSSSLAPRSSRRRFRTPSVRNSLWKLRNRSQSPSKMSWKPDRYEQYYCTYFKLLPQTCTMCTAHIHTNQWPLCLSDLVEPATTGDSHAGIVFCIDLPVQFIYLIRMRLGKCTFSAAAPRLSNSLPNEINTINNTSWFKKHLKLQFLKLAFTRLIVVLRCWTFLFCN